MLLELLSDALPSGNHLPSSYYESKKIIKDLGLGYEKIHACPNDCTLYWGEKKNDECCKVCLTSRWVLNHEKDGDLMEDENDNPKKKKPAKVLRYFPLIPRLKRLYMSSKTASSMRWHMEGRNKDGKLRHPADALAWKEFDKRFPEFVADPRSVRLGLASDGFNPFRTMSTTYSTWPVVLLPYNLEPWACMKQSSLIFSMVIPGEKGPGNDIDVFLQPLIDELKQLWDGVDAFDACIRENFKLRAALMWTINDFSAYANLSGWSTKGRVACPSCGESTHSQWLKNGGKFCYMGHRRWLEHDHHFRYEKDQFDGTVELQTAPLPPFGTEVLGQLSGVNFVYGKSIKSNKKRNREQNESSRIQPNTQQSCSNNEAMHFEDADTFLDENIENCEESRPCLWKKRSIFFDLPYWEFNLLRHNLDVMHIEKNICDNLLGTFLNIDGKSKDNHKARLDLIDMGIRHELHPTAYNGSRRLPQACYTMSSVEKELFLTVLKNMKVPDGYASNISRCVNLKERKIINLKSHDCHVLMQDILPIALRSTFPRQVVAVVTDLCSIFKGLCSKTLDPNEVDLLESKVAETLCRLEKTFLPSFFTIMVHLTVH
ncbi:uncharacterized protein [Euphorbia lathyris]|uniref:uncharacterized protein n=1 Tax=Euphorbia lathyris TaxID=212925 RepID=UPI0033140214